MRVLRDEHLPVKLAASLPEHETSTVRGEGWSGTKNGDLLRAAAEAGSDVLPTNDSSIEHQQNVVRLEIAVLILDAPSNRIEDLSPLMPEASDVIARLAPGEIAHLAGA